MKLPGILKYNARKIKSCTFALRQISKFKEEANAFVEYGGLASSGFVTSRVCTIEYLSDLVYDHYFDTLIQFN
jgi:hypothetical protein